MFFPFFQSMSQYLYLTYLNAPTAPPFRPRYLVFDGIMYILEAACFYVMSRALAPKHWRHFYGAVLTLMAIDIVWTGVTWHRGMPVGAWLWIDIAIVAVLGGTMLTRAASTGTRAAAICCRRGSWWSRSASPPRSATGWRRTSISREAAWP